MKTTEQGTCIGKKEFELSKDIMLLRFITSIQDEAHRFALSIIKAQGKKVQRFGSGTI